MDAKRVFLAEPRCANDPTIRNFDRNQPAARDHRSIGPNMNLASLKEITPVVLTFNEEANIGRTLESLRWATSVVVLDSGSADATEWSAKGFPNVAWHLRQFDKHLAQWEYGIHQTGITTDYVLALDADMQVSE